eukprot:SAG31_NODE_9448_length_1275_cov_4.670068_1_plen_81_part_00
MRLCPFEQRIALTQREVSVCHGLLRNRDQLIPQCAMEVHALLQSDVKFELEALSVRRSQPGLASYVTRRLAEIQSGDIVE